MLNVPGGAQTTESRAKQIVDFGATAVASTPTYAIRLAQEAQRLASTCRVHPSAGSSCPASRARSRPRT